MNTSYGTCHFVGFPHAVKYYGDSKLVREKINNKEIYLGAPSVKKGEKLSVNDEGRYVITTYDNSK